MRYGSNFASYSGGAGFDYCVTGGPDRFYTILVANELC